MFKRSFHELAEHVPPAELDPEVREKLDAIAEAAAGAMPAASGETGGAGEAKA